jgi:hypothetical protein
VIARRLKVIARRIYVIADRKKVIAGHFYPIQACVTLVVPRVGAATARGPRSGDWLRHGAVTLFPDCFSSFFAISSFQPEDDDRECFWAGGAAFVAVNGRHWKEDLLTTAVKEGKDGSAPLELLVENGDFFRTHAVDYHGGLRYPHLVRAEGKEDRLAAVLTARAR